MAAEILINIRPNETRVAYIESGSLMDLKIEKHSSRHHYARTSRYASGFRRYRLR